jgi:hypothetical protein
MLRQGMCNGFITGMIENYLDQLEIEYYSSDDGKVPILITEEIKQQEQEQLDQHKLEFQQLREKLLQQQGQ